MGRSDKLNLARYDTDKIHNRYLEMYDPIFEPWLQKPINLLEIGVYKGGSLHLWRDYFPFAQITGIDLNLPQEFVAGERIQVFQGSQTDKNFLSSMAEMRAPEGFDIIIDDASHVGEWTRQSFWHLFEHHLKPGGLYIIEDWGTGYWWDWPDGWHYRVNGRKDRILDWLRSRSRSFLRIPFSNHSFGMVGFVKQLVDEQGAADWSLGSLHGKIRRKSRFECVLIKPSIVFVYKAKNTSV
jgi:SAM-dependent methyltransferase